MRPIIMNLELGDARQDELENLQCAGNGSGSTIICLIICTALAVAGGKTKYDSLHWESYVSLSNRGNWPEERS
jgi:hypothetical protein